MDLGLAGKRAMIAGGTSGLGLAVAFALAVEGADVAVCGRDADRLAHAAGALGGAGPGRVRADQVDVTRETEVAAWVEATVAELGGLEIVVPNAGGPPPGCATASGLDDYRAALELNLLSSLCLAQYALPHLRRAGWGRVIFIGSIAAKRPAPNGALSNVSRPGVLGFAKSLVHELGSARITVNTLLPGAISTARLAGLDAADPDGARSRADRIPLGRVGEPAEFGAVAAFLASEAASYLTGTAIPVDGGLDGSLY